MAPPNHISYWYGGRHTCHTASGATVTDRQTDRQDRNYIPRRLAGGQHLLQCYCVAGRRFTYNLTTANVNLSVLTTLTERPSSLRSRCEKDGNLSYRSTPCSVSIMCCLFAKLGMGTRKSLSRGGQITYLGESGSKASRSRRQVVKINNSSTERFAVTTNAPKTLQYFQRGQVPPCLCLRAPMKLGQRL